MSDHFVQASRQYTMFQHLRSFCYVGLWAPRDHLDRVASFAGSIRGLEVFCFSLQTTLPLQDFSQQLNWVTRQTLEFAMRTSYLEMMYIFERAAEFADSLEMESCFENLRQVVCLDSSDVVDFDTMDGPRGAWYWLDNDTRSHALIRSESPRLGQR